MCLGLQLSHQGIPYAYVSTGYIWVVWETEDKKHMYFSELHLRWTKPPEEAWKLSELKTCPRDSEMQLLGLKTLVLDDKTRIQKTLTGLKNVPKSRTRVLLEFLFLKPWEGIKAELIV